jgi:hypothetical protein
VNIVATFAMIGATLITGPLMSSRTDVAGGADPTRSWTMVTVQLASRPGAVHGPTPGPGARSGGLVMNRNPVAAVGGGTVQTGFEWTIGF